MGSFFHFSRQSAVKAKKMFIHMINNKNFQMKPQNEIKLKSTLSWIYTK